MSDHRDPETEAQIRRALEARAKEIVVSPEAQDSIRQRRGAALWARPATYAAVAAAVILIAGIALVSRPDDNAGEVNSADSTSTLPDDTPTTTTAPTTTAATSPDTTTPLNVDYPAGFNQNGLAYPELASHPLDVALAGMALSVSGEGVTSKIAAATWAESLGIDDPQLSESTIAVAGSGAAADYPDSRIAVYDVLLRGEDGSVGDRAAMTIVLVSLSDAPAVWHVTHVVTPEFTIDTVEDNTADTIRITGSGRAFEGTATLIVGGDAADDSSSTLLSVGGVEFGFFSVIVPRPAGDRLAIDIEGTTVFEGEVPNIAAYRTIPIPRQTSLSVFGVADDDVLNVRSNAGVSNGIVEALAPDAAGIVPTGAAETVGNDVWWEIEATSGSGWANSRYLVTTRPTGPADEISPTVIESLSTLNPTVLAATLEIGGIGVYADFPTPWTSVDRDAINTDLNWSPEGTDDRTCDCDMTVAEFLGFDTAKWELAEFTPGADAALDEPNFFFEVGQQPDFFERFTTMSVYIPEPNPDVSLDWRRYTVVVDFEDGTPVIRGIWRWGWTP